MKILELTKSADANDPRPYKYKVLIHGKELAFDAKSLANLTANILMRDKFADSTDVEQDLALNYPSIK